MQAEVLALCGWVRSAAPVPGVEKVLIAGDPERATMAKRLAEGIEVDATTLAELRAAAASVGLSPDWVATHLG
jgi:uncharacterized oxidoreductase